MRAFNRQNSIWGILLATIAGCDFELNVAEPLTNAGLVVDERDLHLGEVWEQSELKWTVPIRNPTVREIKIDRFLTSCSCVSAKNGPYIVPAGGSASIEFNLDLRLPNELPADDSIDHPTTYEFKAAIIPKLTGDLSNKAQIWSLQGTVRRAFFNFPKTINIGDFSIDAVEKPSIDVNFTCIPAVAQVRASCESSYATASIETENPGHRKLIIQVSKAPTGRFEFPLRITGIIADGNELPPLEIPVTGRALQDVEIVPPESAIGAVQVDETISGTLLLRSRTGKPIRVETVRCSDDAFTLIPLRLPSQAESSLLAYEFHLRPKHPGNHKATIEFSVESGIQATDLMTIPFRVTYVAYSDLKSDLKLEELSDCSCSISQISVNHGNR